MPSPVSSHLAAHSRQAQTTNAEGAPCWLDIGLCNRLGSPTTHLGQAQTTNAKRAPLMAQLRSLLQTGLPNLFKSKLQRGRRRLYKKLSVAVTDFIISVHACKSYTINAVSGFTKKVLVGYVILIFPLGISYLTMAQSSRTTLSTCCLKQLGIERIFSAPYHMQSNGKLEVFHKYLKPTLKKLCQKVPSNCDKYIN